MVYIYYNLQKNNNLMLKYKKIYIKLSFKVRFKND